MDEMIKKLKEQALSEFCWDIVDNTVREVFEAFDSTPGCNVYWGFWTEKELDTIIQ